jgi:hypothetical protein
MSVSVKPFIPGTKDLEVKILIRISTSRTKVVRIFSDGAAGTADCTFAITPKFSQPIGIRNKFLFHNYHLSYELGATRRLI